MENTNLYEVLGKRRSIRKFAEGKLEDSKLNAIKDFINNVKPLFPDIKTEFTFCTSEEISGKFPGLAKKAPHYLLAWSEKKPYYLENIGFIMEKVDLYLSANGIGSLYLGGAKPKNKNNANGYEYCTMLAFGNTFETLYRNSPYEYKRKKLSEITVVEGSEDILRIACLAPSGFNSQKWFFSGVKQKLVLNRVKLNLIQKPLMNKDNQIDMGIICAFIDIIVAHKNKKANFVVEAGTPPHSKEHKYVLTINL